MYRIHCLNNISKKGTDLLGDDYELTEELGEATGVLVRSAKMHDMEFPESLLAIGRAGAGVNNIPLDRCAEEGIVVFNAPGANSNAVKELVLCGMLLACRGIIGGIGWCRENADDENIGKSAEKAKKQFAGSEILGKTLGVIGLGAIGGKVANAAIALGMDVFGYDPFLSERAAASLDDAVQVVDDLERIYEVSDFISIHVPAVEGNIGMIDAGTIGQMKDGVVFLNFARDTLVNPDDMAAALESGKVRCYVTDFATPAVMKMQNAIVLPHLGASTAEAEENCAKMAASEIKDYIENGNITCSVNYPAVDMGPVKGHRVAVLASADVDIDAVIDAIGDVQASESGVRGGSAYILADTAAEVDVDPVAAIAGVRRVRVIA